MPTHPGTGLGTYIWRILDPRLTYAWRQTRTETIRNWLLQALARLRKVHFC